MKTVTQQWFDKAKEDLETSDVLIKTEHLENIIAFHAQQAVEKCFKAVIEEYKIGFIKTHNLVNLYEIIKPKLDFDFDIEEIIKLNEIYTDSRYPGLAGSLPNGAPDMNDVKAFYQFAQEVYKKIYFFLESSK